MTAAKLNVIDLSNFSGQITDAIAQCWKAAGIRGAVVGCQDVTIATQQATVLARNGFAVELYAFMYWGESTLPEVQKCYQVANNIGLSGTRIWLDCEAEVPNEAAGQTPDGRVAQLAVVRNDALLRGFTTGIYSGIYYWPTYMGNTTRFSTDPFWLADYFDDHRLVDTVNVGGWTAVAMHQFAGSTDLCGVDVDEDDDITGICSHQEDPMTPDEKAAFDALVARVTAVESDDATLNAAVMKRLDLINVATGDYQAMLAAHDKVFPPATAMDAVRDAIDDPIGYIKAYRLGKLPPSPANPNAMQLAAYLDQPLPTPPASWGVLRVKDWPMYGNDRLGDCTCAAAGHMVECWTADEGHEVDVPENAVIAMYNNITGGQDTGAVELDVLRYWQKKGLAGHKPYAFALVDRHAHEHVKLAASLFAGVYLGIALPKSAQSQTGTGKTWAVPPHGGADAQPGSWGGHAVNVVGYDLSTVTVVTWGQLQRMSWAFWDKYVDEAWAILPAEWQHTPPKIAGFDFTKFAKDLAQVGKETS